MPAGRTNTCLAVLGTGLLLSLAGEVAAPLGEGPGPIAERVVPADRPAAVAPALGAFTFVENVGQWDVPASFVATLGSTRVQIRDGEFLVDAHPAGCDERVRLRFELEGARPGIEPRGERRLPGVRNYILGADAERWHTAVRAFEQVVYPGLYEGVDLRLREEKGRLEYDLHLAPGADLASVVLRCAGVEGLELDEQGGLLMHSAQGVLRQSPPETWCVLPSGERQALECNFVVLDATRFGFRLAEHDASLPVVIDPGLEWSTYLGGSTSEAILGLARRGNGQLVVAGRTNSTDFPTEPTPPLQGWAGSVDGFVSVFDPTGSTLEWSTYFGGSAHDRVLDVAVNAAGEVFVSGATASADLPTTAGALSSTHAGGTWDGFVARFAADGSQLLYSSYLGGSQDDYLTDIEVRDPQVISLAGTVASADFPVTSDAVQLTKAGGDDYCLVRLDLDQTGAQQLVYSTFLGGSNHEGLTGLGFYDLQAFQLRLDASDGMIVTGRTASGDFPMGGSSFDPTYNGGADAILARVDPSVPGPSGLTYSTFLGGTFEDVGQTLAVDAAGVITVGGYSFSTDLPTTAGAFQETYVGLATFSDGFLLRLDPGQPPQSQLSYGTYMAGARDDWVRFLQLEPDGKIVGTLAAAASFPTTCGAWSPTSAGGGREVVVFYLSPEGRGKSDLLYSTFVGGDNYDELMGGIEILPGGPTLQVAGAGFTSSTDFPTTPGAFQSSLGGGTHGVAMQLEINPHTYCDAAPNSAGPDGAILCGTGSVGIGDNTFTLEVSGGTPNDFGLFYYGNAPVQIPFYDGTRCVGGSIISRLLPVLQLDPAGKASRLLDFSTPPAGGGPAVILPGSTWYFQFWYRDPAAGGTGANLSNGLKATFYP